MFSNRKVAWKLDEKSEWGDGTNLKFYNFFFRTARE